MAGHHVAARSQGHRARALRQARARRCGVPGANVVTVTGDADPSAVIPGLRAQRGEPGIYNPGRRQTRMATCNSPVFSGTDCRADDGSRWQISDQAAANCEMTERTHGTDSRRGGAMRTMTEHISWRAAQPGRAGSEYRRLDDTKLGWPAVIFQYFNARTAAPTAALGG